MGTPITGIRLAKAGAIKDTKHVVRGVVHEARTHHSGKHVMLEIRHGAQRKPAKGKKSDPFMFDSPPSSSFAIPKHVAKHYPIGTPVHIGITPVGAPGAAMNEDDDEDDGQ